MGQWDSGTVGQWDSVHLDSVVGQCTLGQCSGTVLLNPPGWDFSTPAIWDFSITSTPCICGLETAGNLSSEITYRK